MDSPRGRIDLMRGIAEGKIAWSPAVAAHFDRCLGCMGCVPACPSGVKYDVLIEATRAEREKRVARPLGERIHRGMIFALFPYPRRFKGVPAGPRTPSPAGPPSVPPPRRTLKPP